MGQIKLPNWAISKYRNQSGDAADTGQQRVDREKLMAAYQNRGQLDVDDLDTTKEFSPEQLNIIGQLRSELGDVVSRKQVREWFQNKRKQMENRTLTRHAGSFTTVIF